MTWLKVTCRYLAIAAFALPLVASAEEAEPGVFKVPGTQTTIKINAFVEADLVYDFSGADEDIRGTDWASFVPFQPLDGTPDQQDQPARLYYTARTSRVGFTANTPTGFGPLTVRVEGDFNSPSAFNYSTEATTNGTNFRIRHAYGEFAGLLIGQSWSNFMDLGSLPDTVDFNPHGAFTLTRQPLIKYGFKFGGSSFGIALENPQSIVFGTEVDSDSGHSLTVGRRYDRLPDVTANLTFGFGLGHLNLRGVALEYNGQRKPDDGGAIDHQWGWGAGVSGSLKLALATLVWSVQGGDGIGRYMFQSLFQGAAFVGNEIELWRTIAYHAGVTLALSEGIRSNVIWSQTFFGEDDALAAASPIANRRVDVLYVNTFFKPVTNTEIGVEYSFGRRVIFDSVAVAGNDTGTQHRINALARYTFF